MAYDADTSIDMTQYESMIDLIEQSAQRYGDKTAYSCLKRPPALPKLSVYLVPLPPIFNSIPS